MLYHYVKVFILFVILQITSYLCSIKNKERLSTWTRKEAPLFSLTYCNNKKGFVKSDITCCMLPVCNVLTVYNTFNL